MTGRARPTPIPDPLGLVRWLGAEVSSDGEAYVITEAPERGQDV